LPRRSSDHLAHQNEDSPAEWPSEDGVRPGRVRTGRWLPAHARVAHAPAIGAVDSSAAARRDSAVALPYAGLKINGIFKDNMVLQRNQKVSVYGSATPSSKVTVAFNGQKKSTKADESGNWELKLDPMKKSFQPQKLVVNSDKSNEAVAVTNVLIGDVWLCGGQSNMEHGFGTYPLLKSQAAEINNPDIRSIVMERRSFARPEEEIILKESFADAWHEARQPWMMPLSPFGGSQGDFGGFPRQTEGQKLNTRPGI